MKICAYVQEAYAKQNYKNECMDARQFVGLRVIIDSLERNGYHVDWAGIATVHEYDLVLVSLTADCDWWTFIKERIKWQSGSYKVIVGGAGVLHVAPFLRFADFFSLGRGEESIVNLVRALDGRPYCEDDSIIVSSTFNPDNVYHIRQTDYPYPHRISLAHRNNGYLEGPIGCNHKCFFCGYTWHRKFVSPNKYYAMADGLFGNIEDRERAMLDIQKDPSSVDFSKLRTTAIDGMSERIRKMVNKPISRAIMVDFLNRMMDSPAKPHQIKFYNIVGFPTETEDDWHEFLDTLLEADARRPAQKQWSIVLLSTPFRPMPATPLACAPMAKRNFRGAISAELGPQLKGGLIMQGNQMWCVEGMGTEALATVMLSALAHRGSESDSENIVKLCSTSKFWRSSATVRELTLEKYFDMDYLFGAFTRRTLPNRYVRSYAKVEKLWPEDAR